MKNGLWSSLQLPISSIYLTNCTSSNSASFQLAAMQKLMRTIHNMPCMHEMLSVIHLQYEISVDTEFLQGIKNQGLILFSPQENLYHHNSLIIPIHLPKDNNSGSLYPMNASCFYKILKIASELEKNII